MKSEILGLKRKKKKVQSPVREERGVIVAHYGIAVEVLFDSGERRKVKVKRNSGHVVGDRLVVKGHHIHRLPRRTVLCRKDSRGSVKTMGANLDILGVVVSVLPLPTPGYIDQAVVSARQAGLTPVLVVNKIDLGASQGFIASLETTYGGVLDMFMVSALTGQGLDKLKAYLGQGLRGFFVGVSGVGKSSLLNAICPDLDLKVGQIYEAGKRGCNATTVSTLHVLPGGGELVDTPGFNEFGLSDIDQDTLADVFPGFESFEPGSCRFRNCRHLSEPGCTLQSLVAVGKIREERYLAYTKILEQLDAGDSRFKTRR